ncbi:MAG TPA: SDR family NAD(P)-dependent oxidoreductase [Flavobacteriales bacterium]|nr:SDR family NAD(P)-dependent oxidoreductase [Flavobacteriales bacterium]HIO15544.1 SDR family NAD(P)-dependent oxidoreductase [Flavobacteriales bacterium]
MPKAVWITGASSGIGRACAEVYASQGARVILSSRRKDVLEEVASKLTLQLGLKGDSNFVIAPMDLGDSAAMSGIVNGVLAEVKEVDIMIHCGGISQRSLAIDTSLEVDRRVMEIDYFGTIALTKALLPHFVKRKSGQFVVVTSLMGLFSSPLRSGYCGAKHALHGFFEALRAEHFEDGIGVSLVCPGFIATDISLNAVVGDGSKQGTMDKKTGAGMTPLACAKKIAKGVKKRKSLILIGRSELLAVYIHRFFPGILRRIMRKAAVT